MHGTEPRPLPRARPGAGSAIALLEQPPPHGLPADSSVGELAI